MKESRKEIFLPEGLPRACIKSTWKRESRRNFAYSSQLFP